MTAWGGGLGAIPGGPIPSVAPFDIYCVGPCGPMSVLLTYDEVEQVSAPGQLSVDPTTLDQLLLSGGAVAPTDVRLYVTAAVPQVFTFDFTVRFDKLPTDFTDLVNSHIFLGVTDAAGPCVGLFFSKVGIAYAGSIHHDVGGDMVLDSVFQPLANSQLLVSENDYWSIRIAASFVTGGVYIYVTRTTDLPAIGHQLRYVLPMIPATALAQTPPDRTTISVRGTAAKGAQLALDDMCLASGFVVPNLPPIADAGLDQAVRMCSIVQLDGSRSADPEGAALTYRWRLLDAPLFSRFIFDGLDGATYPLPQPTGFTNKFYAPSLQELELATGVVVGDVLVVAGMPYTITGKGTDQNGYFVSVDGFVLLDNLVMVPFKYLYQNCISGPTTVKPTFYPDAPGIYKFDLVVFDGGLSSPPAIAIINVTESPIPRGCLPDVRFLWDYLSNFWGLGDLREERARITTFWGAMAQIAASELLSLWQIDYNKSLRDVQRTFQRRWLHYDPPLKETQPEMTRLRALHRGCRTVVMPAIGSADFEGTAVTMTSPALAAPVSFVVPAGLLSPILFAGLMQNAFKDKRIKVRVIADRLGADVYLRVDAPFPFTIAETSGSLFLEIENTHPGGTAGAAIGVRTYKTEWSLQHLEVQEGHLLTVDGIAYQILRVTTDASDLWPYQRITLKEDLPLVTASVWNIPCMVTSTTLDFFNGLVSEGDIATLAVLDSVAGEETLYDTLVYGAAAGAPAALPIGAVPVSHFLLEDRYEVQLLQIRRYSYLPLDPLVVDIPYLQDRVQVLDDKTALRRNIDFFIETFREHNAIRFDPAVWDAAPPDLIWAETTYLDNRPDIEANFGIPAAFTLDDLSALPPNVDYLSAVRGLWYSYFNGPTIFNLRAGSQILLGLPFAEETGTIEEIRTDFSLTQGRILVRDAERQEIVRSYTFPASLQMEQNPATQALYKVGDVVQQFSPLVTGVEILDWVKDPRWFEGYMNQGVFYEIEKFHKFLVRVDSAAFNLAALLFVKSFILRIKPTYTYPLFVVLQKVSDTEVSVTDEVLATGVLSLFDGACFSNGAIATMFDDPKSPGGGWWSQFDTDADPATAAPVFPDPQPVAWGYDKNYLCPEDYILASACVTFAVPTIPGFDSIFAWDNEVSTQVIALFQDSAVTTVPYPAGLLLFQPTTCQVNGTITDVQITIIGDPGDDDPNYYFVLTNNNVDQTPIAFTQPAASPFEFHATVSIPVAIGDILSGRILSASAGDTHPFWESILVEVGASVSWSYDTELPEGTYCAYKVM
jgi:hypothetical protein